MAENFTLSTMHNENNDKEFENLCREFAKEVDYHKKTRILHSLIQIFLTHYKEELETDIRATEFLELLSQVPHLCNEFLQTSVSEPCPLKEFESTNNLENKRKNLESASLCFDDVLTCLEAFSVADQCIIIIKISLNILVLGYTHCKESEIIYGDLLEQFADYLGSFYKKIESLQMAVLQVLGELKVAKYQKNDPHIDFIVLEMGNLCQVVFSLDADIAFELWSKYIKIITDHTSLEQISNIRSLSTDLALKNTEILQLIQYNQDKHSEEDEELSAKLFFYLDALSSLLNLVHESFKENISEFRTFLLSLLECLVSSYSSFILHKTCLNIIKTSLVKNTFTLLSHLCPDEEFLKSILIVSGEQTHVGDLLLKLCALQFMKNASLNFKTDLFKSILSSCLSGNTVDDMILCNTIPKSTVTKVDSDELVTLYQFAYEQITEFSKLLPDSVIEELESIMFDYLMSSSDIIYLLISDVWMFRLRCSSIEFFKDRCYSVLQYISTKNISDNKIESFLKRMLRFLPISFKNELLKEFVNVKWIHDNENLKHRYGIPHYTSTDDEELIYSEEQVKTRVCKLNEDSINDSFQLVQKACVCLELCTLFLNYSDCAETLQFIEFASELFKIDVYEIQIAVLTFVKALSRKNLPEHSREFENIVAYMAQLFSEAMHSKNYIVRYEARNIFSYFAKCTPHVKIIQETVRRDPSLKPIMKSYINALPDGNCLSEKEKAEYLKKQSQEMSNISFEIPKSIIESLQQFFSKVNFKLLS